MRLSKMPVFKLLVSTDNNTAKKIDAMVIAVRFLLRHKFFHANCKIHILVKLFYPFNREKIIIDAAVK